MKYLGRQGYEATVEEIEELPDYLEAFKGHGYQIPAGRYKTSSASTHQPAIVDILEDPLSKFPKEVFSHVRIQPPVRDQIVTPLDDEYQFSKY